MSQSANTNRLTSEPRYSNWTFRHEAKAEIDGRHYHFEYDDEERVVIVIKQITASGQRREISYDRKTPEARFNRLAEAIEALLPSV